MTDSSSASPRSEHPDAGSGPVPVKTCATCRWHSDGSYTRTFTKTFDRPERTETTHFVQCRISPPAVVVVGDSSEIYASTQFPVVEPTDWCGDWKAVRDWT